MDRTALEALLPSRMKGLEKYLETADYTLVVDDTLRELNWTLPFTNNFKEFWIIERSKRHLFWLLMTGQTHKFKVKQIHLDQRFKNYEAVIQKMDEDFRQAQEDNPHEFVNVSAVNMFGHVATAGFSSDELGRDTTYLNSNETSFSPTKS